MLFERGETSSLWALLRKGERGPFRDREGLGTLLGPPRALCPSDCRQVTDIWSFEQAVTEALFTDNRTSEGKVSRRETSSLGLVRLDGSSVT